MTNGAFTITFMSATTSIHSFDVTADKMNQSNMMIR